VDEEESEDFMADLLSDFGSSAKSVEKKPIMVNKPKPMTVGASNFARSKLIAQREVGSSLFVKEEPLEQSVQSTEQQHIDDDMTGFDDYDDDMMMDSFNEQLLKTEVEKLTIRGPSKPNFTTINKETDRPDLQNWQTADAGMMDTFNQDTVKNETQSMDIFEADGHLKMWWYDAYERREKGYVYLFGKVLNKGTNKYVSCCVTVKNIERNLFVLPRKFALGGKCQYICLLHFY
jgi:DNA polymerase alpha subunit A